MQFKIRKNKFLFFLLFFSQNNTILGYIKFFS